MQQLRHRCRSRLTASCQTMQVRDHISSVAEQYMLARSLLCHCLQVIESAIAVQAQQAMAQFAPNQLLLNWQSRSSRRYRTRRRLPRQKIVAKQRLTPRCQSDHVVLLAATATLNKIQHGGLSHLERH